MMLKRIAIGFALGAQLLEIEACDQHLMQEPTSVAATPIVSASDDGGWGEDAASGRTVPLGPATAAPGILGNVRMGVGCPPVPLDQMFTTPETTVSLGTVAHVRVLDSPSVRDPIEQPGGTEGGRMRIEGVRAPVTVLWSTGSLRTNRTAILNFQVTVRQYDETGRIGSESFGPFDGHPQRPTIEPGREMIVVLMTDPFTPGEFRVLTARSVAGDRIAEESFGSPAGETIETLRHSVFAAYSNLVATGVR